MLSSFVLAGDLGELFPFAGLFTSQISELSFGRTVPHEFFLNLEWIGNPVRSLVRMAVMQPQLRGKLCVVIPDFKVPIPQLTSH